MEGLLLTAKSSDDKYLYLSKTEKTHKKLRELRKEFEGHTTSSLHSDYDRGYFQSLENYVRKLEKSNLAPEPASEDAKEK